jgi:hypothetical protein
VAPVQAKPLLGLHLVKRRDKVGDNAGGRSVRGRDQQGLELDPRVEGPHDQAIAVVDILVFG